MIMAYFPDSLKWAVQKLEVSVYKGYVKSLHLWAAGIGYNFVVDFLQDQRQILYNFLKSVFDIR